MAETDAIHVDAVETERMEVTVVQMTPVDEFDTQFERSVGFADELVFVQSQDVVVERDHGNRGFADADGADQLGFDERDRVVLCAHDLGERRRGHPTGTAASNDDDVSNAVLLHGSRYLARAST